MATEHTYWTSADGKHWPTEAAANAHDNQKTGNVQSWVASNLSSWVSGGDQNDVAQAIIDNFESLRSVIDQ